MYKRQGEGGPKAKFQANVNAIRLLKELEAAGQQASPEQQEVLSRYVGLSLIHILEQQARSGQPISLMDLAAAAHREEREKKKSVMEPVSYTHL